MLNYFNLELEKRSLKKIAYEVDRADDELLKFVIDETLINSVKNTRTLNLYSKRTVNFNAEAFIIWSNSSLQRESLNSLVVLYDRNQKVLGRFSVGFNQEIDFFDYIKNIDVNHPTLQKIDYPHGSFSNYYVGIIPVIKNEIIQGYIAVATAYNLESLSADRFPEFLESNKAALGSVMELELINIFKFEEGNVTQVYGDIFPSREQRQQIFNTKLSEFNDGWLTVSINSEKYLTFVLKRLENEKELITSVSIKEKEITWDLFNFFKIFIVHTIFNFLLFVILVLLGLIHVQYSFRTRLLFAFLLISIIPTVALAVYNRQIVEERTESSIFNELSKRSNYLENHVRAQKQKHKDREIIKAFDNAGKELGISFAVFGISDQLYNSRKEFYDADLFNRKLNSQAHFTLNYLSYREFLTQESINNFDYSAYYRKISIEENSYIIGVNDAFNKIKLTYSTVDVDILLFGIYSFALIFIAMLSTIFANQISAPIRRLTKATEAVAQGDLNVYLENKEKGEIKGLFDGFNSMTKELQKNQYEIAQLERENAWKEMAKQVAHEIKNPLTPMKLSMQQLIASFSDKKSDFENVFKKLSQSVLNQIDHLSLIASEFSTLAKMPSPKLEVFDLIPVIKDTLNLFTDEKTKMIFTSELDKIDIEADSAQMRRVIINLARNSIQADAKKVEVLVFSENDKIALSFKDDGKGIAAEVQEKIFRPNFTTKDKGMGIGLNLAKRIIENFNGEILLVESSGKGTTFKMLIPIYYSE
jgi:signal transduction histidine kinase